MMNSTQVFGIIELYAMSNTQGFGIIELYVITQYNTS